MFCGSCMHDNSLAKAFRNEGVDAVLIPTYTPLRLDEQSAVGSRIFLGGINLYLDTRWPWWQRSPRWLRKWIDSPTVIRWAAGRGVSNDARELGELTLAMLAGEHGPQRLLVQELAEYLGREFKPDLILFSNALLAGTLSALRKEYSGPIACLLQGDDIFLDSLVEPYASQVRRELSRLSQQFDLFLSHSDFYRRQMGALLNLPLEKIAVAPLGIDLRGHDGQPHDLPSVPTIGYFARICPEKGLHNLVQAAVLLQQRGIAFRLQAGGYLGPRDQAYFESVQQQAAPLGDRFQYLGSPPDHRGKVEFYQQCDLFSVPTDYHEPKGLTILEAMANGIPCVQPAHGAFPELISGSGGGLLVEPGSPAALANGLEQVLTDRNLHRQLAQQGWQSVRERYSIEATARLTLQQLSERLALRLPGTTS